MTLTTTIAGSLPKPGWLSSREQLWAEWRSDGDALVEAKRDAVRLAITDQVEAGIDIVTDGEQTRQHFVTTFIEGLDGVDSTERAKVTIRQRYEANVPRVVGEVSRGRSVYGEDATWLRAATTRPVKFQLPGPMTMVDTLADEHYRDRPTLAMRFAEILNAEARELVEIGVDVIQFDEPAFNVFTDDVRTWGIEALEVAAANLAARTAVHICYGYGIEANIAWKRTLGSEWRQYETIFPILAESRIDQVSLEVANSLVPLELLELLGDKDLMVGVVDVASEIVETPEAVASVIDAVLQHVDIDRVLPCTNCGMVPLPRQVASAKLRALTAGTDLVRGRAS